MRNFNVNEHQASWEHPPEHHESLWMLTVSPTIWAVHFLASYLTVALWCEKVGGPLGAARMAVGVYTLLALAGIGWNGWRGFCRQSFQPADMPHDEDTPLYRHRFLGFATLLLAGLSAVATVFVALTAVFIGNCD